ncbi:putative CAP domain-containing protein [Helianthus annuus]|uniref:CAP domain-containing protein n=2 Tax=Helianthus annuus TaxID=4232 RepID=A0A9K3GY28_HELAN|nr:putative CAP domain-containing protein [Helianthus annuus]KAJ0438356.1 putative CAP domain-containing protein [Helianthus annuus]KAJ0443084.1 putative CAP domain-containing protein [Helianthus annuus]KAJ0460682.1 putative CAP domain-containing protein [Helianthus annuus]KAJ0641094.1 putative CAP domain-containing protein [Helianthus annuus]
MLIQNIHKPAINILYNMGHQRCNISLVVAIFISVLHLSRAQPQFEGKGNSKEDYVNQHNCIRRVLNLPPLVWDDKVAERAQAWANKRTDCAMIHSEGGGENLASGHDLSGLWAVQLWIDERLDYDYSKNECTAMCGHYTQVVWKNTTKVGCGKSRCTDGKSNMIVCNYDPPGNYIGEYPY